MKIHITFVAVAIGFLHAANVPIESKSKHAAALRTFNKGIEKRSLLPLSQTAITNANVMPDNSAITGLSTLVIQIVGGLFQTMLEGSGVTPDTINHTINLFSPENIRTNLVLLRRALNWIQRFASFLNRILPASSPDSNGLNLLKSKVSFYSTQPGLSGIGSLFGIGSLNQNAANSNAVGSSSGSTANTDQTTTEHANLGDVEPSTNIVETTTTPAQNSKSLNNVQIPNSLDNNSKQTAESTTNYPKSSPTSADYDIRSYDVKPKKTNTLKATQMPAVYKTAISTNHTYMTTNDSNKFLPSSNIIVSNTPTNKSSSSADKLAFKPIYGVPLIPLGNNRTNLSNQIPDRLLAQLPLYSKILHMGGGNVHNYDGPVISTYQSIAELPLENDTFFDRQEDNTIDSFGMPVHII